MPLAAAHTHDSSWPTLLAWGIGFLITVIAALFKIRPDPGRTTALRRLSASLGCDFEPGHLPGVAERYNPFGCFARGRAQEAINTIRGVWKPSGRPHPVCMGDFRYITGDEKNPTDHEFSYLIVQLPLPNIPDLIIRREGLMDRVAGALSLESVRFESDEFNRRFHVSCADAKFAYAVITPAMIEFLIDSSGPDLEIRSGYCCIHEDALWAAAGFRARLEWLERFIKLWPGYLIDDLAARGGSAR